MNDKAKIAALRAALKGMLEYTGSIDPSQGMDEFDCDAVKVAAKALALTTDDAEQAVEQMPMRGGEIAPNAYDHLRDQYESIFRDPSALASWRRKQTITGDVDDEYLEMRVQFAWMAFQAGHRIGSRTIPAPIAAEPAPKPWHERMAAHYAQGKSVPFYGTDHFMQQEIDGWRARDIKG